MPCHDRMPCLSDEIVPPTICGTARISELAFRGIPLDGLRRYIADNVKHPDAVAYDEAIALQAAFSRAEGLDRQESLLSRQSLFRVASGDGAPMHGSHTLRVLAIMAPGDLMTNTPLEFLTANLDIRLDLLYLVPGQNLPVAIPDHDVAFFAISEAGAELRDRLATWFAQWPRPAVNDPALLGVLARDALDRAVAAIPSIRSPHIVRATRGRIVLHLASADPVDALLPGCIYPILARPETSHAGHGLTRIDCDEAFIDYLQQTAAPTHYVSEFVDYSGADGMFRKYRVAFIGRRPFLCHMATSPRWMVHYLNAGMLDHADRRDAEAHAMAEFDHGFAHRHADAFAHLCDAVGFDYFSIDCAEAPDGRLLVFEADTAAIVHDMDPPDLFPYKRPQMARVFAAFGDLLRERAAQPVRIAA